jgi:type 1 glutamine amidotransferase
VKRALVLHGGWEGHRPELAADFAERKVLKGFDVVRSADLASLEDLGGFDLLLPVWSRGELPERAEAALLKAVEGGLGVLAWHGAAGAFPGSRDWPFLLGGRFVGHPGGEGVGYEVRFLGNDPLVEGLAPLRVTTEQYHLLVDPAVKVLATTRMRGGDRGWLADVEMPVIWTRAWGRGRVFYCALGHAVETLEPVLSVLRKAAAWAARR